MPVILLLFLTVPLIELALLIYIGSWIGLVPTVGIVLLTGTLGFMIFRHEWGVLTRQWKSTIEAGAFPFETTLEGLLLLLGAAFLLTPGILTDICGFCMVLPGSRAVVRKLVISIGKVKLKEYVVAGKFIHVVRPRGFGGGRPVDPNPMQETDFRVKDEPDDQIS